MADSEFCCVDNYSVLIPYKDLVKLVEIAKYVEVMEQRYKRMEEQYFTSKKKIGEQP